MNKLVVIGSIGRVVAYLNVDPQTAMLRYRQQNPDGPLPRFKNDPSWDGMNTIEVFDFTDQFGGSAIYPQPSSL